jgi:hypothetical protein
LKINEERKWKKLKKEKHFALDKLQMKIEGTKKGFDGFAGSWKN